MTGEELKLKLQKIKVSQTDLAKNLGITKQTVNQILGTADIKTGFIERIANIYGVPLSFFYEKEGAANIASGNGAVASSVINGSVTTNSDNSTRFSCCNDSQTELLISQIKDLKAQLELANKEKANLFTLLTNLTNK